MLSTDSKSGPFLSQNNGSKETVREKNWKAVDYSTKSQANNLQKIDVSFPNGLLTLVCMFPDRVRVSGE